MAARDIVDRMLALVPVDDAPSVRDARTTPRALRPLVAGGIAAAAVYFLLCFQLALVGFGRVPSNAVIDALQPVLWPGRWRMFTDLRTTHTDLDVDVLTDGWRAVDPASLYPARWDEGPGYTRDAFLSDGARVVALAEDICARTGARRVRLTRVVFDKTLGSRAQPRVNAVRTPLVERDCAR